MIWIRRLLIALAALVAVVVVVVGVLLLVVDPNDYKQVLEEEVKTRYNRTLAIDGDIRLSFFPNPGFEVSGVALSEPGSNQMFAAMDSARVSLAWWPLLSRRLEIDHLTVNGLKANLVRDQEGRFNFQDLLKASHDDSGNGGGDHAPDGGHGPSLRLNIRGMTVNGGEAAISDARTRTSIRVERVTAAAKGLALDTPFEFDVSGRVLGQNPRADATIQLQGRMQISAATSTYALQGLDMRVTGMLPGVRANAFSLRGNVEYEGRARRLEVTNLSLSFQGDIALATPLTGVDAALSVQRFQTVLAGDVLHVRKLAVKGQGRANDVPFNLALDAPQLDLDESTAKGGPVQLTFRLAGPSTWESKVVLTDVTGASARELRGALELDVKYTQGDRRGQLVGTSAISAALRGQTFDLPNLDARFQMDTTDKSQGSLTLAVAGAVHASLENERVATEFTGTAGERHTFKAKASLAGFEKPALQFTLDAEQLDVDQLLATFSVVSAKPEKPAVPANEKAGETSHGEVAALPASPAWSGLRADGSIRVGELRVKNLQATDVAARLDLREGRVALSDVRAALYGGTLRGTAFFEGGTQQAGVDGKLSGVAVRPLLEALSGTSTISGTGDVTLALRTVTRGAEEAVARLNGTVAVHVRDGAYQGIDIARSLRMFRDMLGKGRNVTQSADGSLSTDFTELRGQLALENGVGTLHDLMVAAPLLRVTEGTPAIIDLVNETIDLVIHARVVNTSTGQDGKSLEALRDISIPIRFSGDLRQPSYDIRWSEVSSEALKNRLRDEAERQINRLLGGDKDRAGSSANPAGRILGDALKGLFRP